MKHNPTSEYIIKFINQFGEIEAYTLEPNSRVGTISTVDGLQVNACSSFNGHLKIKDKNLNKFKTCFHCNNNDGGKVCISQNGCLYWNQSGCQQCYNCQSCVTSCNKACNACTGCYTCNGCNSCNGICNKSCHTSCNSCISGNCGNSSSCGNNGGHSCTSDGPTCSSCQGSCYNCDGSCNNCVSNTEWSCTSDSGPGSSTGCQWCKTCNQCNAGHAGKVRPLPTCSGSCYGSSSSSSNPSCSQCYGATYSTSCSEAIPPNTPSNCGRYY